MTENPQLVRLVRWLNDLAGSLDYAANEEDTSRLYELADEARAYANRLAQKPIPGLLSRL